MPSHHKGYNIPRHIRTKSAATGNVGVATVGEPVDFVQLLYFLCKITTQDNRLLVYTTSEEEIYYKTTLAKKGLDFQNLQNSLLTQSGNSIKIAIYGEDEGIDLFNSYLELELVGYTPNPGRLTLVSGFIEEYSITNGVIAITVRSIFEKLDRPIGEFFSEFCRTELGDSRCGVNLSTFEHPGKVVNVFDRRTIGGDQKTPDGKYYFNGVIKFNGDPANGKDVFQTRIINQSGNILYLLDPTPYEISVGDTFIATVGCDKAFTTCRDKFRNIVNFRGEPFLNGANLSSVTKKVETYHGGGKK